jgi:uncharacterized protein HemX
VDREQPAYLEPSAMSLDLNNLLPKLFEAGLGVLALVLCALVTGVAIYAMARMQAVHAKAMTDQRASHDERMRQQAELFRETLAEQQREAHGQLQAIAADFRSASTEQAAKFSADLERVMDRLDQHTGAIQQLSAAMLDVRRPGT